MVCRLVLYSGIVSSNLYTYISSYRINIYNRDRICTNSYLYPISTHISVYRVSQKNLALGILPHMATPFPCRHFRGLLNILGGSCIKIKCCQVILKVFHIFLPNFIHKSALLNRKSHYYSNS